MHTVSEMAVAINCFCVVMGVATMLLAVCWGRGWSRSCQLWPGWKLEFKARSIFFCFKSLEPTLNKSHDRYFVVMKSTTSMTVPPLPPLLQLPSSAGCMPANQQTTNGPQHGRRCTNDGKPFFGKRQQDRKDVNNISKLWFLAITSHNIPYKAYSVP